MKQVLFSLFITFFFSFGHAQTESEWQLSFGISSGVPTTRVFNFSLGGDIQLQKRFGSNLFGTLTTGFSHFFEKDHFEGYKQYGSPFNVIPVKTGVKYFLGSPLYISAEVGAGLAFEEWGATFLWSPSLGFAFPNGLDISLKYEDYTKHRITKMLGLRLAYNINAKKLSFHKKTTSMSNWQLGLNINPGLSNTYGNSLAFGADVSLHKYLLDNLETTFSGGYTYLRSREASLIPIKAGLRLYPGSSFYIGGEGGVAIKPDNMNIEFVYAPIIGINLNDKFDIGAKYDIYTNMAEVFALRFGYKIDL
jgi:hypothetical protein